jgi:integrase
MRALDEKQTAELFRLTERTLLHIPVVVAVTTGMRRGEILGLRWQDVDLKAGTATIVQSLEQTREGLRFKSPKTDTSRRAITLPSITAEILRRHKTEQAKQKLALGPAYHDNSLVCARPDGQPVPPDTLSTNFATLIRRKKFPHVRFHDLRHSHATQLLKHGVHPKVVSERLGHSKIGITLDTYSHVMPGMQEEAAQKMDAALRIAVENADD